jgi:V/A-type H+-transporting ATPase subunit D
MLEEIKPTRMELIETKKRSKLAVEGHDLLTQKRDALMVELREFLKKVKDIRQELDEQMPRAFQRLTLAEAVDGAIAVRSASFAVGEAPDVDVTTKNVMGLKAPTIESTEIKKDMLTRGYGVLGTSARIDEATQEFEKALNMALALAESEEALKRIVAEIQRTQRRVNALEYSIIPTLDRVVKDITMKLDEMEREDFFRLKLLKKK